jgi:hypothetical protein
MSCLAVQNEPARTAERVHLEVKTARHRPTLQSRPLHAQGMILCVTCVLDKKLCNKLKTVELHTEKQKVENNNVCGVWSCARVVLRSNKRGSRPDFHSDTHRLI